MKAYYYRKELFFLLLLTLSLFSKAQTSYTWTGAHSSSWNDSLNWTPKGIPQNVDNITTSGASNTLILDQSRTVNTCNLKNTYLNLQGYTFTINGAANFDTIQTTPGGLSFTGPVLSLTKLRTEASVNAVCASITITNSVFDSTAYLERTGSNASDFWGSNIFNEEATIIQNNPNAAWNIGQGMLREIFNGDVAFIAQQGSLLITPVNACLFRGNINLSSSGQGISIGDTSLSFLIGNSIIAPGKAITISSFTSGQLSLYKLIQEGTSPNTLQLSGTASLSMSQCDFGGNISITTGGTDTTKAEITLRNTLFRQSTTINTPLANLQGNRFNVANNAGSETIIIQAAQSASQQLQNSNMIIGTLITKQ